ncbi:MAG: SUMF1/EgtB/PvdO family nonheme iron enzyme [Alphaproteobacteria bacterium]
MTLHGYLKIVLVSVLAVLAQACTTSPGDTVATDADPFRDCSVCPEMVPLPAGSFEMGYDDGRKNERPRHTAVVETPFAIARTETTYDQYLPCVEDGVCNAPHHDRGWGEGALPVIYVDWSDAVAYTRWLSVKTGRTYRLPTEEEWEYAALGGGKRVDGLGRANCSKCIDGWNHRTFPVGQLPPNGFGLYDMLGNAMEWTADCWTPDHRPNGIEDCSKRVRRGGSWYFDRYVSTTSYRYGARPGHVAYDVGFRVVADIAE